jgi:hypothetical protein
VADDTPNRTRTALLVAGVAWSAVLCVLSATLPVYTVSNGQVGPQPRLTLVDRFGTAGLLPAAALLVVAVLVASLLRWGTSEPARGRLLVAQGVAVAVLVLAVAALMVVHAAALLLVPVGAALVGASYASRPVTAPRTPRVELDAA